MPPFCFIGNGHWWNIVHTYKSLRKPLGRVVRRNWTCIWPSFLSPLGIKDWGLYAEPKWEYVTEISQAVLGLKAAFGTYRAVCFHLLPACQIGLDLHACPDLGMDSVKWYPGGVQIIRKLGIDRIFSTIRLLLNATLKFLQKPIEVESNLHKMARWWSMVDLNT